jgi:hypothetical protein
MGKGPDPGLPFHQTHCRMLSMVARLRSAPRKAFLKCAIIFCVVPSFVFSDLV